VGHQTNITKQTFNLNAKVSHRVFSPVFAFKVMHGVPLLTRFRKLLTIASEMGGGWMHVPQVRQWHDTSEQHRTIDEAHLKFRG